MNEALFSHAVQVGFGLISFMPRIETKTQLFIYLMEKGIFFMEYYVIWDFMIPTILQCSQTALMLCLSGL